jgi:hypothetical protein
MRQFSFKLAWWLAPGGNPISTGATQLASRVNAKADPHKTEIPIKSQLQLAHKLAISWGLKNLIL